MEKTTSVLLALAITGIVAGLVFVTGIVNVRAMVALYVALPFGAISFGLFLIAKLLEKEVAVFDNEQQALRTAAERISVRGVQPATKACCPTNQTSEESMFPANAS